ncbi:hypothetical protein IWW55_003009 [Coemansia sp. RSA 2706]|nr:hypothetical protein IWW55_003009 [Coemansia sp. RSA 2706]
MQSLQAQICSICQDKQSDDLYMLSCGHIFHVDCISNYRESQPDATCPKCRALPTESSPLMLQEIAARQTAVERGFVGYVLLLVLLAALFVAACIFVAKSARLV